MIQEFDFEQMGEPRAKYRLTAQSGKCGRGIGMGYRGRFAFRRAVIVRVFTKKTQKTLGREIDAARSRIRRFSADDVARNVSFGLADQRFDVLGTCQRNARNANGTMGNPASPDQVWGRFPAAPAGISLAAAGRR